MTDKPLNSAIFRLKSDLPHPGSRNQTPRRTVECCAIGSCFPLPNRQLKTVPLTPATAEIPLATDAHGVVRVGGTRVTLDSVVGAFRAGATPEEIAQQFPTLVLADIYQVIAYFLNHPEAVESYLANRQIEADSLRTDIECRFDPRGLRARLVARRTAKAS